MQTITAAALQLCCTADRDANRRQLLHLIDRAAGQGAHFIASPENSDAISDRDGRVSNAQDLSGPLVAAVADKARQHGAWILLGSFAEKTPIQTDRIHNTSSLIAPDGSVTAVYRKIHLFDAQPPDGVPYRESATVIAGTEPVVADTPWAKVGLSICYDLRFPELYRHLSSQGAEVLCVPSAFTVPTGQAHWELLLRARAVENLGFVVAPAQVGAHGLGRASYGHALIVDPWGRVLADAGGEGPGLALATLDADVLRKSREMIPALGHRRM